VTEEAVRSACKTALTASRAGPATAVVTLMHRGRLEAEVIRTMREVVAKWDIRCGARRRWRAGPDQPDDERRNACRAGALRAETGGGAYVTLTGATLRDRCGLTGTASARGSCVGGSGTVGAAPVAARAVASL
jgi:hypothetical protein